MLEDEKKQGFSAKLFKNSINTSEKILTYYPLDAEMSATVNIGSGTNEDIQKPFLGAFRIPQPDLSGACNNFYSAQFMSNKATECT